MELLVLVLELLLTSLALTDDSKVASVGEQNFSHESSAPISSSLPFLPKGEYKDVGRVVQLGDLPVYIVGDAASPPPTKAVVWNYDIFGFDGGRTRQLCDVLASRGYLVALPDYYRGTFQDPSQPGTGEFLSRVSNWTSLEADWSRHLQPFLTDKGVTRFGTIGTCWGTYVTVKLSTLPAFSAGVSMHPSHSPIMALLGEDEEATLRDITGPQVMMSARTDSPNVKPGGLAEKVLGERVSLIEFNEMEHGWTTRGNISIPAVARDLLKAMQTAIAFFDAHL